MGRKGGQDRMDFSGPVSSSVESRGGGVGTFAS